MGQCACTTVLCKAVKREHIGKYLGNEAAGPVHRRSDQTPNRSLSSVKERSGDGL